MNRRSQNKNQYELTVIKTEQYLSQEKIISESAATINDSQKIITLNNQENETEWFYIKIIQKIRYKSIVWKIITFGCLNDLIEAKTNDEIKPWLNKLTILQEKNKAEMLRTNQLIIKAEEVINENSKKSYINNIVIQQEINNDELFYDALDNQPWLTMKAGTANSI